MVLYGHQGRGPYARAERRKQISGTPSAGIILLWEATEMKKTMKLAALILALMMAFSLMAVTAAAYGAEEHDETCCEESIQPRKPAAPVCPYCGTVTTDMGFVWEGGTRYIKFQCLGCRDFTTRVRY